MNSAFHLIFFSVLLFLYSSYVSAESFNEESFKDEVVLKLPKPRATFDISHDYHITLLNMALKQAARGRVIPKFEFLESTMSQGRAKIELIKGEMLDVYWLGSDLETEQELRAIKIPTTRGLIGYRKFIINESSLALFDKVKSVDDLKKFIACQGTHWPDTKILGEAKLPVISSTIYENLFKMLGSKRCDYFPRANHDIENELSILKEQYPELIKYDRILLHYPFAVYFYTNKSNEVLARWIEEGLNELAEIGKIEALMVNHDLTKHMYPLKDESHTLYLPLNNTLLDPNTDTSNRNLWIIPKDFGIEIK